MDMGWKSSCLAFLIARTFSVVMNKWQTYCLGTVASAHVTTKVEGFRSACLRDDCALVVSRSPLNVLNLVMREGREISNLTTFRQLLRMSDCQLVRLVLNPLVHSLWLSGPEALRSWTYANW